METTHEKESIYKDWKFLTLKENYTVWDPQMQYRVGFDFQPISA